MKRRWWLIALLVWGAGTLVQAVDMGPGPGGTGGTGAAPMTIVDEVTNLPLRSKLTFLGPGVTCVDNSGANSTDCTISGSGSGGHTILDETTALTARAKLTFLGAGVTCVDNAINNASECTIPGGTGPTLADEGVTLTLRPTLNFLGAGVTCVDNPGASRTDCTIPGATAVGTPGHLIADEGAGLPQRSMLNLLGAGVTCADNSGNNSTDCTIPGATGLPGHTIVDETTVLTTRAKLTFLGAGVTCVDNSSGNATECTIPGATVAGTPGHSIADESTSLPQRATLNFLGSGVTCVDNSGSNRTDCTIAGSGALTPGHLVADEGSGLPQRPMLNFVGAGISCSDNAGSGSTDCSVPGASGLPGHAVRDEATALPQRPTLAFLGAGVTCSDNPGTNSTDCAIAGGGTGGGNVVSVFGRTGAVIALTGDYQVSQVTNAADITAANVFPNAAGQTMRKVILPGQTSGSLTFQAPAFSGASTLTFPAGVMDFSATGGASQVVRQSSLGGALTVGQLAAADLSNGVLGTGAVVLATGLNAYQPQLTAGAGIALAGTTLSTASTTANFLSNGGGTDLSGGLNAQGKMQVMADGSLEYTDGALSAVVRKGTLIPAPLVWTATASSCASDPNSGKLTIVGTSIVCASDIGGGGGGGGAVSSVFARIGAVTAQSGDYTAAQVTNAADLAAPNVFSAATGQTMRKVLLPGATSGLLTVQAAAVAGSGTTLTLPGATTDFSTTGGASRVVQQSTLGGGFTVGQLSASDLSNGVTGTGAVVLASALPPVGAVPIGSAGTLQAADGAGGLAAFSGSTCADPQNPMMVGISANGAAQCQSVPQIGTTAHVLTDRAETSAPNAINLGTRGSGILTSTVASGVAALTTLPQPAGDLVGTTAVQELDNKRVNARVATLPNVAIQNLDLSAMDGAVISNLTQPTFFKNPTGVAKAGQLLRLQVHSTVAQALTWDTFYATGIGFPLPTATTGGSLYDTFWFQYNSATGQLDIIFNSQLSRLTVPSGVTPGNYTCPTALSVDLFGKVTAITGSTCGTGGGGTAAGAVGDVQVKGASGLTSDSGKFTQDVTNHWTTVQQLLAGTGSGAIAVTDPHSFSQTLRAPSLTANRVAYLPDRDGVIPLTPGGVAGHLAVYASDGVGLVDGGVPGTGGGGSGDFSSNTSTSVDGEVVLFSGTGGKTGKRATGTGLARLTSGVQSASELSGDCTTSGSNATTCASLAGGTVAAANVLTDSNTKTVTNKRTIPRVTTLSSAATNPTFTCVWTNSDECLITATGAAGTLTMATPSGTAQDGEMLLMRFVCTNAQTFSWSSAFLASLSTPLPTTCPADTTKEYHVGTQYSGSLAKYQIIASDDSMSGGGGGGGSGANPTAQVGLSAVNGSASTFLRSDAAPALDQTITPVWTGLHTWGAQGTPWAIQLEPSTIETRAYFLSNHDVTISGVNDNVLALGWNWKNGARVDTSEPAWWLQFESDFNATPGSVRMYEWHINYINAAGTAIRPFAVSTYRTGPGITDTSDISLSGNVYFFESTGTTANVQIIPGQLQLSGSTAIYGMTNNVDFLRVKNTGGTFTNVAKLNTSNWLNIHPPVQLDNELYANGGITIVFADRLMENWVSWTDGAGALTGTLTNAPKSGNPTKWIKILDNGVTRWIPTW